MYINFRYLIKKFFIFYFLFYYNSISFGSFDVFQSTLNPKNITSIINNSKDTDSNFFHTFYELFGIDLQEPLTYIQHYPNIAYILDNHTLTCHILISR